MPLLHADQVPRFLRDVILTQSTLQRDRGGDAAITRLGGEQTERFVPGRHVRQRWLAQQLAHVDRTRDAARSELVQPRELLVGEPYRDPVAALHGCLKTESTGSGARRVPHRRSNAGKVEVIPPPGTRAKFTAVRKIHRSKLQACSRLPLVGSCGLPPPPPAGPRLEGNRSENADREVAADTVVG